MDILPLKEKFNKILTTNPEGKGLSPSNKPKKKGFYTYCKNLEHTVVECRKKKNSINIVVPTETKDSTNNSGDIYHLHSYHTNFVDNEDLDYNTEVGYHVLGIPDDISVPFNLVPHVSDASSSSIFHICHVKYLYEAKILLDHQSLFFNKKPKPIKISPTIFTFGKNVTKVKVFINKSQSHGYRKFRSSCKCNLFKSRQTNKNGS